MARFYARLDATIRQLKFEIEPYCADIGTLTDPKQLQDLFDACSKCFQRFEATLPVYVSAETMVVNQLKTVIDAESQTGGWQELIDIARDPIGLHKALVERAANVALEKELSEAIRQIDRGSESVLEEKFGVLSQKVTDWWELLRPEEPSFFSAVAPRPKARRTIDFKAGLAVDSDRKGTKFRDVIAVFSQSQLHCLGLALFLARAVHERVGFLVLDDPILSSDEDHRACFNAVVVEKLIEIGIQIIVLTQDQKTKRELEERYLHKEIKAFQLSMEDPLRGTSVRYASDTLAAKLARVEILVRSAGHPDLRKQACRELRDVAERFCRQVLVAYRFASGERTAAVSDYEGKNLGELSPKIEPLLIKDPSHPGKWRALRLHLNPGSHDDEIPSQGALKTCLGDLKHLKKTYLG